MEAVKARVEQKGFNVQRIETDDGCYDVHGMRKNGDRVELKLHAVGAAILEKNIKYARPAVTSAGPAAPVR